MLKYMFERGNVFERDTAREKPSFVPIYTNYQITVIRLHLIILIFILEINAALIKQNLPLIVLWKMCFIVTASWNAD